MAGRSSAGVGKPGVAHRPRGGARTPRVPAGATLPSVRLAQSSMRMLRRPTGTYIPRFRNVGVQGEAKVAFLRGYGIQAGAGRDGWARGADEPGLGVELKQRLREPGPWQISLQGYGECLPRHENFVDLDPTRTDQWGIPLLRVHCAWGENERAIREDVKTQAGG